MCFMSFTATIFQSMILIYGTGKSIFTSGMVFVSFNVSIVLKMTCTFLQKGNQSVVEGN